MTTMTDRTGPRAVFIVRGERHGEAEATNFRACVCSVGWHDTPNPLVCTFDELQEHGERYWLHEDGTPAPGGPSQVWTFAHARASPRRCRKPGSCWSETALF